LSAFPQLSVADVHAALAYYLDHRREIEQQMVAGDQLAAEMAAAQGTTRFTRLRDSLTDGSINGGSDAAIPSG
jgi:hypothetical protein